VKVKPHEIETPKTFRRASASTFGPSNVGFTGGARRASESAMTTTAQEQWLIWSHEHRAWWAANQCGYVVKRSNAGRYSFDEACLIVANANFGLEDYPHEAMVKDQGEFEP
jgi:hypothetical protein